MCCLLVCVNGPLWTDFQINGMEWNLLKQCMSFRNIYSCFTFFCALGCVHTDTSTSTSMCPGFDLQLVEASLVRVKRSRSLYNMRQICATAFVHYIIVI